MRGSDFRDTLIGDGGDNTLDGGLGLNTLVGGAGDDLLIGRNRAGDSGVAIKDFTSADYQSATGGLNILLSATGTVTGDASVGTDTLEGVARIFGSNFDDVFVADDLVRANTDTSKFVDFVGGGGNDTITGNGNTRISYFTATSGVTVDLVAGTAVGDASVGADTILGGIGSVRGSNFGDTLIGTDLFSASFRPRGGDDVIIGGSGAFDQVRYSNAQSGVSIDLSLGTVTNDGFGGADTLSGIENIRGGRFDDTLIGDANDNELRGEAGADFFDGRGGIDEVDYFTAFNDVTGGVFVDLGNGTAIDASGATDTLLNIENIAGTNFDDTLIGDAGDNRILARNGNDLIVGSAGDDFLVGGTDATNNDFNQVDYSAGTAPLTVNLGVSDSFGTVTSAEFGTDTLQFIDRIFGGAGDDVLTRGTFNSGQFGSFIEFEGGAGDDIITGVVGLATRVGYSRDISGVTVDLGEGFALDGFGGTDTLIDVNQIRGSAFDDTLLGGDGADFESFRGQGGDDFIDGGGGASDRVDYLNSPAGVDVNLSTGIARDGFGGTDTLSNIEFIRGSNNADRLVGDAGDNQIRGQDGADFIDGGDGIDTADYRSSTPGGVTVDLAAGTAIDQSGAVDTLVNIENIIGTDDRDTLIGDSGANTLNSGNGVDLIVGSAGNDLLIGGTRAGGDDFNQVDYSAGTAALTINLGVVDALGTVTSGWSLTLGTLF